MQQCRTTNNTHCQKCGSVDQPVILTVNSYASNFENVPSVMTAVMDDVILVLHIHTFKNQTVYSLLLSIPLKTHQLYKQFTVQNTFQ